MKVRIGVRRSIVVHYDVHPFNINAPTKNISCNKDTLFESLKCGISSDTARNRQVSRIERQSESSVPFFLGETRMNIDGRKVTRNEQFAQFNRTRNGFNENDDLSREVQCQQDKPGGLGRTWLNSRVSSNSFSFLFFPTSSNLTKCCWSPCKVNFVSSSTKISRGWRGDR